MGRPHKPERRRAFGFYKPFNDWYLHAMVSDGRRPGCSDIATWYKANLRDAFPGSAKPTLKEVVTHAKGLKLPHVARQVQHAAYLRRKARLAEQRRRQQDGDHPTSDAAAPSSEAAAAAVEAGVSVVQASDVVNSLDVVLTNHAHAAAPAATDSDSDNDSSSSDSDSSTREASSSYTTCPSQGDDVQWSDGDELELFSIDLPDLDTLLAAQPLEALLCLSDFDDALLLPDCRARASPGSPSSAPVSAHGPAVLLSLPHPAASTSGMQSPFLTPACPSGSPSPAPSCWDARSFLVTPSALAHASTASSAGQPSQCGASPSLPWASLEQEMCELLADIQSSELGVCPTVTPGFTAQALSL